MKMIKVKIEIMKVVNRVNGNDSEDRNEDRDIRCDRVREPP